MTRLIYAYEFPFDGDVFSVHVSSDDKVYVRLDDLCNLLGLDWRKQRKQILDDPFLQDKLAIFSADAENGRTSEDFLFFDFGAVSYWLNTLMHTPLKRLDVKNRVMRFAREYMSMYQILTEHGFVTPYSEEWRAVKQSEINTLRPK